MEKTNPRSLEIAPSRLPLMVYDGDCKFCRAAVDRWREETGDRLHFVPYQEARRELSKIDERDFRRAVHFIDTDGSVSCGAEAIFRAMARCGQKRWPLWLYTSLPPFALAAEFFYRLVAANRTPIAFGYRMWYGRDLQPPTYFIASTLFLRLLGVVYLIAFVSLWTQIDGLVGDRGILPAESFLNAVKQHFAEQSPPVSPVWNLPTLAWISPYDGFFKFLCAGGTLLSVLLILGLLPLPTLVLLWLFYLSLFHVGQVFLSFQWDILLLETGFIAIFMAPFVLRSKHFMDRHPSRLAIWLVWWLLFRLMFESGAVKLTWNDGQLDPEGMPVANTWELLTALDFHYWTQPLPIWTSWYAATWPQWFQKLSVIFVFGVELVLPWLIFGPRALRYVAFGGISALMLLIAATGNYNFFNLLAFVLALTLLDDKVWPGRMRNRISGNGATWFFSPTRWRSLLLVPVSVLILSLGALQVWEAIAPSRELHPSLESELNIAQFCLVNDYGLFRQMTETRPEIFIEGSDDGAEWKPYEFRWKPGELSRPPGFNTPHQPRLDWQMWFEALRFEQVFKVTGTVDPRNMSPWFQSFLMRLFSGEPTIVALLAKNPFANAPPKFIRVALYQYGFTDRAQRQQTGNWWRREQVWVGPGMSLAQ